MYVPGLFFTTTVLLVPNTYREARRQKREGNVDVNVEIKY